MTENVNPRAGSIDPSLAAGNLTATQELSLQRIELLCEASQELSAQLPDYLGMTLFGSTARGEARPDSDVDIFAFIEANPNSSAQQSPFEWGKGHEIETVSGKGESTSGTVGFAGYLGVHSAEIVKAIHSKGIEKVGLIQLPISAEIIDQTTDTLIENTRTFGETRESKDVPRNVRALFHIPIDDLKLRPYVKQVIDKLGGSPYGEDAWSHTRQMVNGFERGRKGSDLRAVLHRYIPKTLQEARDYYLGPV